MPAMTAVNDSMMGSVRPSPSKLSVSRNQPAQTRTLVDRASIYEPTTYTSRSFRSTTRRKPVRVSTDFPAKLAFDVIRPIAQ